MKCCYVNIKNGGSEGSTYSLWLSCIHKYQVKLEKMSYCSWFGFHEIVVKESATSYLEQKCLNFAPINKASRLGRDSSSRLGISLN